MLPFSRYYRLFNIEDFVMAFSDYIVFVDESGDHSLESIDKVYPVFVLCFLVIKKDEYVNALIPKVKELKIQTFGHDNIILHEHDIRKKKGIFSRLSKEPREAFLESLSEIIDELDFTLISIIIDKKEHKRRYSYPEHPYHLAMMFGLERLHDFARLHGQVDKTMHVICEARGRKEDGDLELAFRRVCDGANRSGRNYPFSIEIADKLTNSEGLQLADLMARPIGLSKIRPEQENRAYAILEKKFFTGSYGSTIHGNGRKEFP